MPMREPYPPKPPMPKKPKSAAKMMGPRKKKPIPSEAPKRQMPKPKGFANIGERVARPAKKRVTSGSTSARIRNMEKKYRRRLMEK
jgi:hypothetical protein